MAVTRSTVSPASLVSMPLDSWSLVRYRLYSSTRFLLDSSSENQTSRFSPVSGFNQYRDLTEESSLSPVYTSPRQAIDAVILLEPEGCA